MLLIKFLSKIIKHQNQKNSKGMVLDYSRLFSLGHNLSVTTLYFVVKKANQSQECDFVHLNVADTILRFGDNNVLQTTRPFHRTNSLMRA